MILSTGFNFYFNEDVIQNVKFNLNPGPPVVEKSIGSYLFNNKKWLIAGETIEYVVVPRDMYSNFLTLNNSVNISAFTYTF